MNRQAYLKISKINCINESTLPIMASSDFETKVNELKIFGKASPVTSVDTVFDIPSDLAWQVLLVTSIIRPSCVHNLI